MAFLFKNKIKIILISILFLAAFLRLYRIGEYMTFLGDEGRDLLEVLRILSGDLVFLGPRSSAADFYYGPIYFYFITPFLLLFNYDPVGPAVFIALIGVATVYLIFYAGQKLLDTKAALFAATLYAISPVVIAYSRSSWNPNPLPFISLLTLYIAYTAVKKRSLKRFFIVGILMGIAIQLQYLALFLGIVLFFFILIGSIITFETKNPGQYKNSTFQIVKIISNVEFFSWEFFSSFLLRISNLFLGFLVGWSPFLLFEISKGFPNLRTITTFIFSGSSEKPYIEGAGFFQQIGTAFFNLFGRLVTRFPPPEQVNITENADLRLWYYVTIALAIVSAIGIFFIKDKLGKLLFIIWFFVGIFLFGFYKKEIFDYYLGFMFPLPFLLIGNLVSVASIKNIVISLIVYIVSVLSLYHTQISSQLLQYSPSVFRNFLGHYGILYFFYIVLLLFIIFINWRRRILLKQLAIRSVGGLVFFTLMFVNIQGYPFQFTPNRQKDQVKKISHFVMSKAEDKPYNFALLTLGNSDHAYRYFMEIAKKPPVKLEPLEKDPERKSITDQLLIVCEDSNCQPLGNGLWEVAGFGRAEIAGEWNVSVVKIYKLVHYKE